jgi:acetyl-CoA acyltransferase
VQALLSGFASTVLVLGVEKLYAPRRSDSFRALNGAVDTPFLAATGLDAGRGSVFVSSIYPDRFRRYQADWGLDPIALAEIAVKNRAHAALNPMAQYTDPLTVQDVLSARQVVEPLTTLMCAPISDGASALVLTTTDSANADGRRPVWIGGSAVGMGGPPSAVSSVSRVARRAYQQAGITPAQIDLAETHDSISFNEMSAYEELGLCDQGAGAPLVRDGHTKLGGRIPVNTSGGLESRGHPVAATGGAQIIELVQQIRGEAGERQVPDVQFAVAENAGGFAVDDTASIAITVLGARPK